MEELLRSPLRVHGALHSPSSTDGERQSSLIAALRERGAPVDEVSEAEFASAADTETPQGILAIAEVPDLRLDEVSERLKDSFTMLVLDAIQDPGNVGTILRTAAALGAAATVALPGTVDLWNAKVVRSSMGAHFQHPALVCTWAELTSFLDGRGVAFWGTDASGEPLDEVLRAGASALPSRLAIAVGNEGGGLSTLTRQRADRMVALPVTTAVESLNVAVATGIILYGLRR